MEGVVPGQMAPLQNRHRQYRPHIYPNRPNIKKKCYYYYSEIDRGDFAVWRFDLPSKL